ncbi:hypothetical protein FACS1894187_16010 [Synergistales bacterium]|nr:hypothetical protein FACS1894187_16010 [Synergistales bacterium]
MLIVVANNKGGQGKTLTATLLSRYLASNPENEGNILCCDLDHTQQNFKENMAESSIPVTTLVPVENAPLCIVDTPPSLNKEVIQVIKNADILIVPIILGKHSVQGVMRITEIRGKNDLRLVVNEWDASSIQKQSEEFLSEKGFKFFGKIPKYKRLAYNIDVGLDWYAGFTDPTIEKITDILNKLLKG